MAGNGPPCPANPRHGRLYSWDRANSPGRDYFCSHQDHGGNGRYYTTAEANGAYEMKETDVASIIRTAAEEVISGKIDLETAINQVAKQTKRAGASVREALQDQISVLETEAKEKAAQAEEKKMAKAQPKEKKETAGRGRPKQEHVEPAEFAAVRDRLGLKNKDVSAALAAAGQGSTLSRVTELTHSKGSSRSLFEKYVVALEAYAATAKPID